MIKQLHYFISPLALSILLMVWPSNPILAAEYGPNEVRHVTHSRNLDVINYVICLNTEFGNTPRRLSIRQALSQSQTKCQGFANALPNSPNEPNAQDIQQSILECGFGPGGYSPDMNCSGGSVKQPSPPPPPRHPPQTANFPIPAGSWGGKVRSGPGTDFRQVGSLHEGEPVILLANSQIMMNGYPWFKIRFRGNQTGYKWGGILCALGKPVPGIFEICR